MVEVSVLIEHRRWWTRLRAYVYVGIAIPIEERPVDKSRPADAIALLALEIVYGALLTLEDRDQLDSFRIRGVAPELRGDEPLDPGLDGGVDDRGLCTDTRAREGGDNGVLAREGGDERCLAEVCLVDLDVGGKCGGALLAGEDGDIQPRFCIEGCEDGGTEVAASLEDVSSASARGEHRIVVSVTQELRTPRRMTFLIN